MPPDLSRITRQLSVATHELKGELHGMMQKTDLLLADPDVPPSIREQIVRLSQQIDRARVRSEELRITSQFLVDKPIVPTLAPFFVHHTVRSILKTAAMARNGGPHAVEVSSVISEKNEYRPMRVDRHLLELAILNIVDGACTGSMEDAPVVVHVTDTPHSTLLTHVRYTHGPLAADDGRKQDRLQDFCGVDTVAISTTEAIIRSHGGEVRVHFNLGVAHCMVWLPLR